MTVQRRLFSARLLCNLMVPMLMVASGSAYAQEASAVARIEFNDGHVSTQLLELPARTRFRLEIVNNGKTPAEFESRSLGVEIVVPPGATRTRAMPPKLAGTYPFFDDFHMDTTQGHIIIK